MYTIKVEYTTGNSFVSERDVGEVEFQWETIEAAKKAMNAIKEHYIAYRKAESSWRRNSADDTLNENEPWFVKPNANMAGGDSWKYSVILPDNNGEYNNWKAYPFWTGYFERLNALEVIAVDNDKDMRIEF